MSIGAQNRLQLAAVCSVGLSIAIILGINAKELLSQSAYLRKELDLEKKTRNELEKELEHEKEKRAADRAGRISTQKKLRDQVKQNISESGGQLFKFVYLLE
tara:strand:+ start:309 stop:614 length:306 start_codon:yes stop_codon:yes gene_type:complete